MYILLGILFIFATAFTGVVFIESWKNDEIKLILLCFVFAVIFAVSTIFCFAKAQEEKVREEIVKENLNQEGRIMKANELMIGDWVQEEYGNLIQVQEILTDGINGEWDGCECYGVEAYNDYIKPIPLTYEILKKNGWKDAEFWCEYQDGKNTIQCCLPDMRGRINGIEIEHFQCEYVHQYQHLLRLCGLNELADNFKF